MPFYRAFANRLGRWLHRMPRAAPVATPEQSKLSWANGLLEAAVSETRRERVDCGPCDWTSPSAYWRGASTLDDFDEFIAGVLGSVPEASLTGHPSARLPGSASFVFAGTSGEAVLLELERRGGRGHLLRGRRKRGQIDRLDHRPAPPPRSSLLS